jgi:hypothetical protein
MQQWQKEACSGLLVDRKISRNVVFAVISCRGIANSQEVFPVIAFSNLLVAPACLKQAAVTAGCDNSCFAYQAASFNMPGRNPEHPRCRDGIDSPSFPPGDFIAEAMDVTVMNSA